MPLALHGKTCTLAPLEQSGGTMRALYLAEGTLSVSDSAVSRRRQSRSHPARSC
jgi:hypothetical protein